MPDKPNYAAELPMMYSNRKARKRGRVTKAPRAREDEPAHDERAMPVIAKRKGARRASPGIAMNIRLPPNLHRAVGEMSNARGVPMSSLIVLWIWEGINGTEWAPSSEAPPTNDRTGENNDDC